MNKTKKPSAVLSAREGALRVLYAVFHQGGYSNMELKQLLHEGMPRRERALCTELVYGVLQNYKMLDFYIRSYSKGSLSKLEPYIKIILELGVYQVIYLDKVPDMAACDECVKLAHRYGKNHKVSGYVNGVLRTIVREKENLPRLNEPTKEGYYAKAYSLPEWLVAMWLEQYGLETTRGLCASCNERRDTVLRVNTLKAHDEQVIQELQGKNIPCEPVLGLPHALRIRHTGDLSHLEAYQQGWMTAQDIGSQLTVAALAPQSGETVLDLCSAPGGKAVLMAQYMENQGRIVAFDVHQHKTEIIAKNAQRMGASIIETQCGDMSMFLPEWEGKADRVLCDVPCSGLGIMAKKPDIRLNGQEAVQQLPQLQYKILKNALRYVKKGGIVLYSTCTLNQKENEGNIMRALQEHPEFCLEPFSHSYHEITSEGMLTLMPHLYESDGFFICKLRRR